MNARKWILLALCLSMLALAASAMGKQATLTIDVPPEQWKAIRLQNLPKDAAVAVQVQSNGKVAVAFVREDDYKRSPSSVRPLFHGLAETRLSFSVIIPAADNYLVVFDNRKATEARAITVTIRAVPGKSDETTQKMHREFERRLGTFERRLNQVFDFDPFPIRAKQCGTPQAFSGPSGIVLCQEFAVMLLATLDDKAKAADALMFTIFHELGHVLLKQWQYPFFNNEEVADEFATSLLVMFGQKARVHAAAEFLAANPSVIEAIAKVFRDDRHPLSAQRARNILRWLRDPQLVHKWQKIFVPHMQTTMLEKIQRQSPNWANIALIEQELATRRKFPN
jgi:hypothetical protein